MNSVHVHVSNAQNMICQMLIVLNVGLFYAISYLEVVVATTGQPSYRKILKMFMFALLTCTILGQIFIPYVRHTLTLPRHFKDIYG